MGASDAHVLVLTANSNDSNSYTTDWLRAFLLHPGLAVTHIDLLNPRPAERVRRALMSVDGVVLLHSVLADSLDPLRRVLGPLIDRRVPLFALIGNEINLPWAPLSGKRELLHEIRAEHIGTQLLPEAGEYLYGSIPGAVIHHMPHAVDPDQFWFREPPDRTPLTIGTRSARYLPIIGDQERPEYFEAVTEAARKSGWQVDIGESRFDSSGWLTYLHSLDVAVATEAGSYFTEPSDDLVIEILAWAREQARGYSVPVDNPLRRMVSRLPWQWRQWLRRRMRGGIVTNDLQVLADVDPEEVFSQFFADRAHAPVYTKALSSRHIEAAAAGVPQLLLAGRYNDILEPDVHYVAVSHDLHDLDVALERLRAPHERKRIAVQARDLCIDAHTLNRRIGDITVEIWKR